MHTRRLLIMGLLFPAVGCLAPAQPQLTSLHSFGAPAVAAANPAARLLQASDGRLYGTTAAGGGVGQGTVFRINPDGSGFELLKGFTDPTNDGLRPLGALLEASDGALYGTTAAGGQYGFGTLFRLGKDGGSFSLLKSFSGGVDGAAPEAALLEGSDGLLYGTASRGGTNDYGVVFRLGKDGSGFTPLVQFGGTNGANPESELIEASDGILYGTTASSNTNTLLGTVFRLQKDGSGFATLARFISTSLIKTNGAAPQARLVEGTNGLLYGTTPAGGTKGMGTLYRLNKDGTGLVTLYHFGTNSTVDGRSPLGELLLASDGLFYGTTFDGGTNGNGTVFRINQDGTGYTNLANLVSSQGPAAGLIEATNGVFYATSQWGGVAGDGTVFGLQKDGSSFAVLKSFSASGEDGQFPDAPPLASGPDQLFGTTRLGGSLAAGTVYRLRFDALGYAPISSLESPGGPEDLVGALLQLTNGTLVGASRFGGSANNGAIFSLDSSGGNFGVVYSPSNSNLGQELRGCLIQASDGCLYGTTISGGTGGGGTVFRLNPDGTGYAVLKNFTGRGGADGQNPVTSLLEGSDGELYGTTCFGGTTNRGVVFTISRDGTRYAVLKDFGAAAGAGENPRSPLIEASDGRLYGTAYGGGSTNSGGTVFGLNKDGTGFQVLLAFTAVAADGRHPCGALVEWADGALYGTTERGGATDQGTLFRVNKDGSGYRVLASFGGTLGAHPSGGLVQGPDGSLYGTAEQDGDMGFGTVFRYGPVFGDLVGVQLISEIPVVTAVGYPGTNYVLERTGQLGPLASWTPVLSTNAPANGRFSVSDEAGAVNPRPQAFYRLRQ